MYLLLLYADSDKRRFKLASQIFILSYACMHYIRGDVLRGAHTISSKVYSRMHAVEKVQRVTRRVYHQRGKPRLIGTTNANLRPCRAMGDIGHEWRQMRQLCLASCDRKYQYRVQFKV